MKQSIRLAPGKHPQPKCVDYNDETAVLAFEREMRSYRGCNEQFALVPADGRIDGAWRVEGGSGAAYMVDVVDGSGTNDCCGCPDFLTNGLGTCKHLEAVRRAFSTASDLGAAYRKLGPMPSVPVLTVRGEGHLSIEPVGKWTPAQLRSFGLSGGKRSPGSSATRSAGVLVRPDSGVRVVHAAAPAKARIDVRNELTYRRNAVTRAFSSGKLGTDVLALPLFPYQQDGVMHLARAGRALLADDMGLGKTVQAIAACEVLRRRGEAQRVLIVTPASLKDQWAKELQTYAGENAVVVGGGPGARRQALSSDAPYKILNYELTWRELQELQALDADVLVLDEAQRAKNFRTKTAATLRAIPSKFLFVLTGTPVENRLDDLYSLMQLVDPNVFGPLWKFNLEFHTQNEKGRVVGYKNLSGLRARIAPVVLRRRKEDVLLQLPPLTQQTRHTAMTKEQITLEEEFRAKAAQLMSIAERRPLRKEEQERLMMYLLKARQACNALELCDPDNAKRASPKLDEFETLVGEIASQGNAKILVFSEWVEMLKLAGERLEKAGIGYEMLYGGIPTEKRPALLQRFREEPDLRVLLSSDAGGVGLNLQVASYVIHLDLPWNPGKLDQRTARAHRLGQTRGVSVTYLCAERGIERGIEGTLAGKRAVREAALDASSQVEELEAPSFTMFLTTLREVFDSLGLPSQDAGVEDLQPGGVELPVSDAGDSPQQYVALPASGEAEAPQDEVVQVSEPTSPAAMVAGQPAGTTAGRANSGAVRARDRLRFAELVLKEKFHADAVRAAYDGVATVIGALVEGDRPSTHEAIVAAIYRELLPSGRLPCAAHGVLARVRDLMSLEQHGVQVDEETARQAVADAREWIDRLAPQV